MVLEADQCETDSIDVLETVESVEVDADDRITEFEDEVELIDRSETEKVYNNEEMMTLTLSLGCVKKPNGGHTRRAHPSGVMSRCTMHITQKYFTFNHRLKIHSSQSNLNFKRFWKKS